jgi:3-mercaptopyruvate sulfurtransferase SseA
VAQKLHDQYGFSYDNLKVLLGGWNAWSAAGYPTETSAAPSGSSGSTGGVTSNTIPLTLGTAVVITGGGTTKP